MSIKDDAIRFLDVRADRDEKRRQIDFDRQNELKALEKLDSGTEKHLRIITVKNAIQNDEETYQQLNNELVEIIAELKPQLIEVKATHADPLEIHVINQTYASVWLDDVGEIQGIRRFTKLNQ